MYTSFWRGKGKDKIREHGVGFVVKKSLFKFLKLGKDGSERIYSLLLHTSDETVDLVSAYVPTLYFSQHIKDEFSYQLSKKIQTLLNEEQLLILRALNTREGA